MIVIMTYLNNVIIISYVIKYNIGDSSLIMIL